MTEKSSLLKDLEGEDCIPKQEFINYSISSVLSNQSVIPLQLESTFAIAGLVHPINPMTSLDKSNTSPKNTLNTKLSPILVPDLIGKERGFYPFWNEYTKEKSDRLWLPTKTDCVDLDLNSLSSSLRKQGHNSWFTVKTMKNRVKVKNYQTTSSRSSRPLWQELTDEDQVSIVREEKSKKKKKKNSLSNSKQTKVPAAKTKKIKLQPTPNQKLILNKWFGTCRWTYNKCINEVKVGIKDKKTLRSRWLNTDVLVDFPWVLETPYDVRDEAMNDLLKAVSYQDSTGKKYELKYRSRKSRSESIVISSKSYKRKGVFYPTLFGKEPIKSTEPLPDKLDYDTRLQRTRLGDFYLCILSPLEMKKDKPKTKNGKGGVISLDPGVRTFMTGYDPSGYSYEWGKNDMDRITRLAISSDKLISKTKDTRINHKKRYSLTRAYLRINQKIRRLVNDLHEKLSRWLVDNYRVVIIPEFNTSSIIKRGDRKIRNKTARAMVTWSHYSFRQKLISKSRETPWCKIIYTTEEYTSKTCGCCGQINHTLGGSKIFKCKHCKTEIDRDYNGARGILLLTLTKMESGFLIPRVEGINPFYVVA